MGTQPTEESLLYRYAEMIEILAKGNGAQELEAHILAMGRTEMHHLIAFLFIRCFELDMAMQSLRNQEGVTDEVSNNDG